MHKVTIEYENGTKITTEGNFVAVGIKKERGIELHINGPGGKHSLADIDEVMKAHMIDYLQKIGFFTIPHMASLLEEAVEHYMKEEEDATIHRNFN